MAAQIGTVTMNLGGKDRDFPLLTMDDLVSLTNQTPSPTGELIDINALDKWSKHVVGCSRVIHASLRKVDPATTWDQVTAMGSVLRRTQVANKILIDSLLSGEEPDAPPKAEGQNSA